MKLATTEVKPKLKVKLNSVVDFSLENVTDRLADIGDIESDNET